MAWMKKHESNLKVMQQWCQAHGQDISDYYDHLRAGDPADGLEVLLTSLAINIHINLVFEDSMWATGKEGVDFKFPTVVCATSSFLPCKLYHVDSGELADVDTTKTSDSLDLDPGFVLVSL